MLWSFLSFAMFGLLGLLAESATAKIVLHSISTISFFVGSHQLAAWKAQNRDAEWASFGRRVGAELEKNPFSGFLAQFADNPWQSWPEEGDITLERVLRGQRENPAFCIADIAFNKVKRDEDISFFTVTFVIVFINTAQGARFLEQSTIPKRYTAFVGGNSLFMYRQSSNRHPGDYLNAMEIEDALIKTLAVASQLEALAARSLAARGAPRTDAS